MITDTETLIEALEILSRDIQSDDGIANAAIAEAACRMRELHEANKASISFSALDGMIDKVARAMYYRRGIEARTIPFEQSCEERLICLSQAQASINAIKEETRKV